MADRTALNEVLTIKEAAEEFGVSVKTIHSAVKDGRIDARQSGATWLVLRDEVSAQWPNGPHRGVSAKQYQRVRAGTLVP